MLKISVINPTGEKIEAELVRFFEAYGKKYLVYTLNEKDEQGYVKLYVCRVDEDFGDGTAKTLVGEFIDQEEEWTTVKNEFKKMISSNGENINDLNPNELANINVRGHRIIKLLADHVNSLSANQKQFAASTPAQPVAPAPAPSFDESMPAADFSDYQTPAYAQPSYQTPASPQPAYQAPATPQNVVPSFDYQAPAAPQNAAPSFDYQTPATPQNVAPSFDYQTPAYNQPSYQTPASPIPEMPAYQPPIQPSPMYQSQSQAANYEEMYNDLKVKFDRCNAELEKVTNENIELRIKIDDIREILEEN